MGNSKLKYVWSLQVYKMSSNMWFDKVKNAGLVSNEKVDLMKPYIMLNYLLEINEGDSFQIECILLWTFIIKHVHMQRDIFFTLIQHLLISFLVTRVLWIVKVIQTIKTLTFGSQLRSMHMRGGVGCKSVPRFKGIFINVREWILKLPSYFFILGVKIPSCLESLG
jgi:hypothetical protein